MFSINFIVKMPSLQSFVLYFLIVVVLVTFDVYCGDGTVSVNRQAAPAPFDNNNPWQKLSNRNPVSPSWGDANQRSPTTTPWPALGVRRPVNQESNSPSGGNQNVPSYAQTAANRNTGVELSYGLLNPGQNTKPNQNRNIGVDLSYGLNPGGARGNQNAIFGASQNQQNGGAQTPVAGLSSLNGPSSSAQKPAGDVNHQKNFPRGQTDQNQKNANGENGKLSEDDELREFSEALLKKDVNNAAKYVTVNVQAKTTSRSTVDEASEPLLTIESKAFDVPTIARMLLLHNNYILETNKNEHVTPQEKAEENSFLDEVLSTSVMEHTRNFLVKKGKVSKDPKDFRDKLKEMWFNMYSRGGGKIGSSGFEHVFLAELKGNDVSGLHNWLYFNEAESKKQANYLGYMKKIEFGNKGAIVKYHFQLGGKDKPVGSMFIGTSPEIELALYSTCFIMRADKVCPLSLGGKKFIIRTFTFRYRGKNMVGSAFPEI